MFAESLKWDVFIKAKIQIILHSLNMKKVNLFTISFASCDNLVVLTFRKYEAKEIFRLLFILLEL